MRVETSEYDYNDRVFINCPFDEPYLPLFRAIIFTTYYCGFYPTSSLTEENGLDNRLDKITRIIEQCRYGIHDISRTESIPAGLPRFNMPFELGLFFGAHRYGRGNQKSKNALILECEKYSYQKFLSDINGVDIQAHQNQPFKIIQHVRNWLSNNSRSTTIPGVNAILKSYIEFDNRLHELSFILGFSDSKELSFTDFCYILERWLANTPKPVFVVNS